MHLSTAKLRLGYDVTQHTRLKHDGSEVTSSDGSINFTPRPPVLMMPAASSTVGRGSEAETIASAGIARIQALCAAGQQIPPGRPQHRISAQRDVAEAHCVTRRVSGCRPPKMAALLAATDRQTREKKAWVRLNVKIVASDVIALDQVRKYYTVIIVPKETGQLDVDNCPV